MKVLIIQQKMIGDVLTSSILCEVLKKRFHKSEIHYLINEHTTAVLENNPYIDKWIVFTTEHEENVSKRKELHKTLRSENYDYVVDVYAKLGSARLTQTIKPKESISYYKWYTKWFYSTTLKREKRSYSPAGLAIENRIGLIEKLIGTTFDHVQPKIYLTKEEKEQAQSKIESHGIDLNKKLYQISALGSGDSKTYPLPYLAQLLDYIVTHTDAQLLFNYIPSQRSQVDELYKLCSQYTQEHIFLECYGKTLREFMALTYHCDALIGNEGGAVNMAKAMDIPTFAIFCPWIKKEAWSIFDDGEKHVSVHLYDYIDYVPNFDEKTRAQRAAPKNYQRFTPELIIPRLHSFIVHTAIETTNTRLSATIITFNEEKNIARCIESLLPVADDIVIVDSFSTDRTEEICSTYPVRFIKNTFKGHIQQKNYALEQAKYAHVVSLDADEALSKEAQAAILRLKRNFTKDGYYIQRYNNYCGQWIDFSDWNPDRKLRIFDKREAHWDGINPHDQIFMTSGSQTDRLQGEILHWVHRTHEEHEKKVHKFSTIAAGEYYKLGRTANWFDINIKPLWIFTRSYIFRMGFLDGKNGLILCKFSAQTTHLKYTKLRELIKQKKLQTS